MGILKPHFLWLSLKVINNDYMNTSWCEFESNGIFHSSSYHINAMFFLTGRQLLLCRVALGKPFYQFSAVKMAHAPPGHHSVIGRPSSEGLSFAEYVVYRGEQVCLAF